MVEVGADEDPSVDVARDGGQDVRSAARRDLLLERIEASCTERSEHFLPSREPARGPWLAARASR